jgi:hypothetical protein
MIRRCVTYVPSIMYATELCDPALSLAGVGWSLVTFLVSFPLNKETRSNSNGQTNERSSNVLQQKNENNKFYSEIFPRSFGSCCFRLAGTFEWPIPDIDPLVTAQIAIVEKQVF